MPNTNSGSRDQLRHAARHAMIERGLTPDFSPEAIREATSLHETAITPSDGIRDLRGLLWASIDNDESRDLDQISVAAPAENGATKILVGIADVAATVKQGSAIDKHAAANTTSVYTAAQVFPMLPERLSTDLTSLNEGHDRLAIILEMTVSPEGKVIASDVYRAVVKNHAKLAYNSLAAWLDGKAPAPARVTAVPGLDEQLRLQDRVAQALRALRHEHGSLGLDTRQDHPVFEDDVIANLIPDVDNRAKQLIEDFMVSANGVTVKFLENRKFPSIRRVLRSPERWSRIVDLANTLGEKLPPAPNAIALATFLRARKEKDPTRFADLSLSVVKLLGRGEYVLELPGQASDGHFGLAVKDYTHSTAPNRRFPDLITQRLIHAALAHTPVPYKNEELGALAKHCTEQEDNAAKVERRVVKSAGALLLSGKIGQKFQGIVTGASIKGTWVRIENPGVEGKLNHDVAGLDVGDHVTVELQSVNVERGFIDFVRARH